MAFDAAKSLMKEVWDKQKIAIISAGIISSLFSVLFVSMIIAQNISVLNDRRDSASHINDFAKGGAAIDHDRVIASIGRRHGFWGWTDAVKSRAFWEYSIMDQKGEVPADDGKHLSKEETEVLLLSYRVFQARRGTEDVAYYDNQIDRWLYPIVLAIGALSTMFVAVNAKFKNNFVSVLAIFFSALATFSGAWYKYYGVQDRYQEELQQTKALGRLHDEMVFYIAGMSEEGDKIDSNIIASWEARYLSLYDAKSKQKGDGERH